MEVYIEKRGNKFFANIDIPDGYAYIGELKNTQEEALQDARNWLDARGLRHPVTHRADL
jgi:hypothetical protein